jgi:hypothetical protein
VGSRLLAKPRRHPGCKQFRRRGLTPCCFEPHTPAGRPTTPPSRATQHTRCSTRPTHSQAPAMATIGRAATQPTRPQPQPTAQMQRQQEQQRLQPLTPPARRCRPQRPCRRHCRHRRRPCQYPRLLRTQPPSVQPATQPTQPPPTQPVQRRPAQLLLTRQLRFRQPSSLTLSATTTTLLLLRHRLLPSSTPPILSRRPFSSRSTCQLQCRHLSTRPCQCRQQQRRCRHHRQSCLSTPLQPLHLPAR